MQLHDLIFDQMKTSMNWVNNANKRAQRSKLVSQKTGKLPERYIKERQYGNQGIEDIIRSISRAESDLGAIVGEDHDLDRTRRAGVHPALAWSMLWEGSSVPLVLRVGMPLTKGWSVGVLAPLGGAGSLDKLGDLEVALRRPLMGVEGAASPSGTEAAGGLVVLRPPVLTGVPDPIFPKSPKRLTRRERGVAVLA